MPELPEVETVRRGLAPYLEGRSLVRVDVRRADLRIPVPRDFAGRATNRRVERLWRRGKYLLMELDDGATIIAHLGMSGRLVLAGNGVNGQGRHDHVSFETEDGTHIVFNDPRRFGLITLADPGDLENHPLLAAMGPEPLDPAFDGAVISAALRTRSASIKAALLDQHVMAGIGNIYACEALFRAGISPRRKAKGVAGQRAERLVLALKQVLTEAIEAGGASLRDHRRPDGGLGYFQHSFAVYGREGEPCPGCNCDRDETGGIRRMVQGGRSTFFCPHRQR
ncbi:MAG: bifunctional DNA-formamidopyrimidine glycosylase/DNA-(apurinic or apyrimidinic site) lyase [Alphaproteobacteria bacterium]|nr:bifunctional DNA-formamidopyrimidine glycosylase/DNA-(apurinic or apyrimidinic site) lyase [Alphaproteobacteria bacterium]